MEYSCCVHLCFKVSVTKKKKHIFRFRSHLARLRLIAGADCAAGVPKLDFLFRQLKQTHRSSKALSRRAASAPQALPPIHNAHLVYTVIHANLLYITSTERTVYT